MNIIAAIKQEERKLEKELHKLRRKLEGVRSGRKSTRRFRWPRVTHGKEAGTVRGWKSEHY